MKRPSFPLLASLLIAIFLSGLPRFPADAIPNSFFGNGNFIGPIVPAHPRFNVNLTGAFLSKTNWDRNKFPGPWVDHPVAGRETHHRMAAMPVLFGAVPDSVVARTEDERLREIVITYLDAGTYFPYLAGGEKTHAQRESGDARRSEFDTHWHRLEKDLRQRLEAGCGPGQQSVSGRSDLLRSVVLDYQWDEFRLRLARRKDHSIALHLSLAEEPAPAFLSAQVAALEARRERKAWLQSRTTLNERGETIIEGIPSFDQGFTPYCGVHALAMVSHYHGLRLLPGELAAGAEFANTGSARGSRILDLYRAVGEELDLKMSHSSRFDAARVERAVEAGLPVVVWRRVALERERAHSRFAERLQRDPSAPLPLFSSAALGTLPERGDKGSPSHASVIHGIDRESNTIAYLEPWGETAGERRMRIEEMEATAYAVFYYQP